MTRLWYVSFIKISSHKETESSQTNKVFIRGKKIKYAWVDRWGRLRKNLLPCGCLNPLYEAFLPGFFLASHLICLVLSLYLAYLRLLPHVCSALSQRWILAKRPMGKLTSPYYGVATPPFWPLWNFSPNVYLGRSPWPREWEICSLLSGRGLAFSAVVFILD